jgi:hypothetical protein
LLGVDGNVGMDYVIARALGKDDLQVEVRRLLEEGFEPLGSPFVAQEYWTAAGSGPVTATWFFYQAMIRRAPIAVVQEGISAEAMDALKRAFLDLHESGYLEEILRKADEVLESSEDAKR